MARSRREARDLISRGLVRVNGRRSSKGAAVLPSDEINVETRPEPKITPNPDLAIDVLYEDGDLLVVNKPGLMPCYPLASEETDTVMNAIAAKFPETASAGTNPLEGGLVHRLDNGTSGALLIARTPEAFERLRAILRAGNISRRYLALVQGALTGNLEIDAPIAHHPRSKRKMVVTRDSMESERLKARPAFTSITPTRKLGAFTLVSVVPRTGMRHQIRVHLAMHGHQIAGDLLYGGPAMQGLADGRFFLHLEALQIPLPNGTSIEVKAPLPDDLTAILEALT